MRTTLLIMSSLVLSTVLQAVNLIPGDSSFETGFGEWVPTGSIVEDQTAPDGSKVLKLSSRLTTNVTFQLKPGLPYNFSLYMRAEGTAAPVVVQAYRTNWSGRNANAFPTVTQEWKRYELTIPPQKIGDHNKFWLVVAPKNNATIYLDATQLEQASATTPYKAAEPLPFICHVKSPVDGHLFLQGEPLDLDLDVYNSTSTHASPPYEVTVTDYYGRNILKQQGKLAIQAHGTARKRISIPQPKAKGFFVVDYGLTDMTGRHRTKRTSFCVLAKPVKRPLYGRNFFGISGGPLNRIPALERMGVQTQALAFRWAYQRKDGEFHPEQLSMVDRQLDVCLKHRIEPVIYLRRTPPWATMKPSSTDIFPPKLEVAHRYEDFAYKVAQRYRGKIRFYQLWGGEADLLSDRVANELGKDREWFSDLVAKLGIYGYKGIKRADPQATVSTTSVSGVDCTHSKFAFQSKVLKKQKGYFDQVTIHPYCYPSHFDGDKYVESPEDHQITQIYHDISRLAGNKPVCNGEWGYSIGQQEPYDSAASRRMAAYMVRGFLLTATCPQVQHVMYYTVAANDVYSIWDWPHPRPAVAAYSAMAGIMTGFASPKQLNFGSLVRAYSFTHPQGSVAVMWIPTNKAVRFKMPEHHGLHILDMMGNQVQVDPKGCVKLTGEPLYLTSSLTQMQLNEVLRKGKPIIQPVTVNLRLQDRKTLNLYVVNQLNTELDGQISLELPTRTGTRTLTRKFTKLRVGITEKLPMELPEDLDFTALQKTLIKGQARTSQGVVSITQHMELIPCRKITHPPRIDGDLEEWLPHQAMVLDSTENLFPPDAYSHGLWKSPSDLSVSAWTAWDDTYFYFAARVTDDIFINTHPQDKLWAGDCIQMAFDTQNDALTPGFKQDEVEVNLAFSQKENRTVVSQTWPLGGRFPKSIKAIVKRNGAFIDYEMAIPFTLLNRLKPEAGRAFGFNFVVPDTDLNRIDYWMGLSYGICGGKDPSVFKKFVLVDEPENQEKP